MKNLVSLLFVVSACSASVDEGPSGGDDMPPDSGGDDPGEMTESATVRFLYTTVRDERGDTIDFATGEPVHTHAGPSVTIGGTACPDIYKYSYLLGAAAPRFGDEVTPNPLQWKVELKNTKTLDLAQSAFRVRGAADDWHPLPALAGGISTITLTRDVFPALERAGEYFVDIRTIGTDGTETITSACFRMHPLTPPIEVQQARADALATMTLAANAPISRLFEPGARVPAFSQRIVHHVAEPITLVIGAPTPAATYTKRVVDDFVVSGTGTSGVLCSSDVDGFVSTDPVCTELSPPADPADATASGVLGSGTWTLEVLDEATGAPSAHCEVSGLAAYCQLPPRAPTGAAISLSIVLSLGDATHLAPSASGPFGEHAIGGVTYTGRPVATAYRCAEFGSITKNGFTNTFCKTHVEYTRIHALDRASLAFAQVAFGLSTTSTGTPAQITHVPDVARTIAPFTWDAGDDDLPGPQ